MECDAHVCVSSGGTVYKCASDSSSGSGGSDSSFTGSSISNQL